MHDQNLTILRMTDKRVHRTEVPELAVLIRDIAQVSALYNSYISILDDSNDDEEFQQAIQASLECQLAMSAEDCG